MKSERAVKAFSRGGERVTGAIAPREDIRFFFVLLWQLTGLVWLLLSALAGRLTPER